VKSSFKNVSQRVHKVFKVPVSSNHLTTECTEIKHLGNISVASACCLSDLCEKFFAFLQPSTRFMNNPG
jgi:inhibitor of KinA sporulation pathway (predicted exonuclease)